MEAVGGGSEEGVRAPLGIDALTHSIAQDIVHSIASTQVEDTVASILASTVPLAATPDDGDGEDQGELGFECGRGACSCAKH
jgi:hypothetical protein